MSGPLKLFPTVDRPNTSDSSDLAFDLAADFHARRPDEPKLRIEDVCQDHPEWIERVKEILESDGFFEESLPEVPGYQLGEEIGQGGMGVVYRAFDEELHRDVAIKILQTRYPVDSSAAKRFVAEARIAAQLQHPGIPAIYRVSTLADGRPFLAMKLIKGRTLDERLAAGEEINHLAVMESIAQALGYAHARNVIHRDLKPQNVMIGQFGEVQLMDWGLAKVLDPSSNDTPTTPDDAEATSTTIRPGRESDFTQAGSVMGTPSCMAPEQAAGELNRIGKPSDVFGLGAIWCKLLTGQPPFTGSDADSVRRNALRGKTDEALARLAACGAEPEAVALCRMCLAFEPEDRPKDANEVATKVAELRQAADERAKLAEQEKISARVQLAEQRKRRVVWAGLAAAMFIGIGACVALTIWALNSAKAARMQTERADDETGKAILARVYAEEESSKHKFSEKQAKKNLGLVAIFEGINKYENQEPLKGQLWMSEAIRRLKDNQDYYDMQVLRHDLYKRYSNVHMPTDSYLFKDKSEYICRSVDGKKYLTHMHGIYEIHDLINKTCIQLALKSIYNPRTAIFSKGGDLVAIGDMGGKVNIFYTKNGEKKTSEFSHPFPIYNCMFSNENKELLVTSQSVYLWDIERNELKLPKISHRFTVMFSTFSNSSNQIASVCQEGIVKITDRSNGKLIREFKTHKNWVWSLVFSYDDSCIACSSDDRWAQIWDVNNGNAIGDKLIHDGKVTETIFSKDGRLLATASADGKCYIWHRINGKRAIDPINFKSPITKIMFSDDSQLLIASCKNGKVTIVNTKSGLSIAPPLEHGHIVRDFMYHNNNTIASVCDDNCVRIWCVSTRKSTTVPLVNDLSGENIAAVTEDGLFCVVHHDNKIKIYDNRRKIFLSQSFDCANNYCSLAISNDSNILAFSNRDNEISIFETTSINQTCKQIVTQKHITGTKILESSRKLFVKTRDYKLNQGGEQVEVWSLSTYLKEGVFSGVPLFSNNNKFIMLYDKSDMSVCIRIYDSESLSHVLYQFTLNADISNAILSNNGSSLYFSRKNSIFRYDIATNKEFHLLEHDHLNGLALSFDDTRLVAFSSSGVAKVFNTKKNYSVSQTTKINSDISHAFFSADSKILFTASDGFFVQIWETETGLPLCRPLDISNDKWLNAYIQKIAKNGYTMMDERNSIFCMRYDESVKQLLAFTKDNTVRIWQLSPDHISDQSRFACANFFTSLYFDVNGTLQLLPYSELKRSLHDYFSSE